MLSLVADWKASGLTQKAFGVLHGINVATLGYWVAKSKEQESGTNGFIGMSFEYELSNVLLEILQC